MKRLTRKSLLKNWSLKATALFLALILWLFVRGEPGPERVVAVPLEVQVPHQMEITSERPTTVEVTMRGAAFSNLWFGQSVPTCVIDLQGAGEGQHIVTLTSDNIRLAKGSGIEVLQVVPARVTIILERTVFREVPIVVPVKDDPPKGYEIYRKTVRPATVVISGPRSRIDPLEQVLSEPVSIKTQKKSTRYYVRLDLRDDTIRSSVEPPIQVDIMIGPRRRLQTITKVPVAIADAAHETFPSHVSVQVLAPPDAVEKLKPDIIEVLVDTTNINVSKLPVKIKPSVRLLNDLDGTVDLRETRPSEIEIRPKKQ
ncbi:MAG TPA: CdaR family protein [Acidobacteriota bacterium]|nr:CdaR family protein [Acidobacteriota bacterium]